MDEKLPVVHVTSCPAGNTITETATNQGDLASMPQSGGQGAYRILDKNNTASCGWSISCLITILTFDKRESHHVARQGGPSWIVCQISIDHDLAHDVDITVILALSNSHTRRSADKLVINQQARTTQGRLSAA